jgi:hypothetical protein
LSYTIMFGFLFTYHGSTDAHILIPSWNGLNFAQLLQATTEANAHYIWKGRWSSICTRCRVSASQGLKAVKSLKYPE